MTTLDVISAKLNSLAELPANWDSYGGLPVRVDIVAAAKAFAGAVPGFSDSLPLVVPCSGGGLQFEWHGSGKFVGMEFVTAETIDFIHGHIGDSEGWTTGEFPVTDTAKASELISWFLAK